MSGWPSPAADLMRQLLTTFINAQLSADADCVCGARWGQFSEPGTTQRNGNRHRDLDTRTGTLDVAIAKVRAGTYFPEWLFERQRRAEAALNSVTATCYLLGGLHPPDGRGRPVVGHHRAVERNTPRARSKNTANPTTFAARWARLEFLTIMSYQNHSSLLSRKNSFTPDPGQASISWPKNCLPGSRSTTTAPDALPRSTI